MFRVVYLFESCEAAVGKICRALSGAKLQGGLRASGGRKDETRRVRPHLARWLRPSQLLYVVVVGVRLRGCDDGSTLAANVYGGAKMALCIPATRIPMRQGWELPDPTFGTSEFRCRVVALTRPGVVLVFASDLGSRARASVDRCHVPCTLQ